MSNEHEVPVAREMARELGMEFRTTPNWDPNYSPVRDPKTRAENSWATLTEDICQQLWVQPQINWDGKVLGCCINYWGDFGGNAFRDGLRASVNTEQIQYARAMLIGRAPPREDIPCTRCYIYQGMREHGRWLERPPPPPPNWSRRCVPTIARPALKKIYWGVYRRAQRWLAKGDTRIALLPRLGKGKSPSPQAKGHWRA